MDFTEYYSITLINISICSILNEDVLNVKQLWLYIGFQIFIVLSLYYGDKHDLSTARLAEVLIDCLFESIIIYCILVYISQFLEFGSGCMIFFDQRERGAEALNKFALFSSHHPFIGSLKTVYFSLCTLRKTVILA